MAYVFLTIILAFAAVSTVYLRANDFNAETLEVIFPAIGAIALTLYLGVKSIYIDAPKPEMLRVTIAILHDTVSGNISAMARPTLSDSPEMMNEFRALRKIDTYPIYNDFKNLDVLQALKGKTKDDGTVADGVLLNLIEYAILDWFTQPDMMAGYRDSGSVYLIQGGGGGGSLPSDLVPVKISPGNNDWNPFLKTRDLQISLPKGSTLSRKRINNIGVELTINTPHSIIVAQVTPRAGGVFEEAFEPVGKRIRQLFSLPEKTPGLWVHGFVAEIVTRQKSFARFSDKAKMEQIWVRRIREQFERDFSWDKLRRHYADS